MKNLLRVLQAEREWTQADLAERLQESRQTDRTRFRCAPQRRGKGLKFLFSGGAQRLPAQQGTADVLAFAL